MVSSRCHLSWRSDGIAPKGAGGATSPAAATAAETGSAEEARTLLFYEAPHRILETLADLEAVFGSDVRVVVARELTKIHEEFLRGTVAEARRELESRDRIRGEICLLVEALPLGRRRQDGQTAATEAVADQVARLKAESGMDEKEALKRLARERGLSKSEVYRELQRERARRR